MLWCVPRGSTERDAPVPMGLRLFTSHPAPQSLAPRGFIGRDASVPGGELRSSAGHTSHLVAWIRQESSKIRYLWRLTDSEVSSLFGGLAYPCNKVAETGNFNH